MIIIKDLSGIQELNPKQLTKIVGGATEEARTPEVIAYEPIDFPTCPLYLFPNGIIGHLCPGEPIPELPDEVLLF